MRVLCTPALLRVARTVLRSGKGDEGLREELSRAVRVSEDIGAQSDSDSDLDPVPAHLTADAVVAAWRLAKSLDESECPPLHKLLAGCTAYYPDPVQEWRRSRPKDLRKSTKKMRQQCEQKEYRTMTANVDRVSLALKAREERMGFKDGMTMGFDFLMALLIVPCAAYMIAVLSARHEWRWYLTGLACAGVVVVEGVLITIRLSRMDGYLEPVKRREPEPEPVPVSAAADKPKED
eukprot:TRINITY_DN26950_c0_g1_i1.p1 TRINITY_DN26950_c0_g1~~TRINITY_DN26950_c0_g1_i1.p1  ORF type:complete len:254 (+),score=50.93 TRINITY_DN26950_c0_g1_i1:59-763(+)